MKKWIVWGLYPADLYSSWMSWKQQVKREGSEQSLEYLMEFEVRDAVRKWIGALDEGWGIVLGEEKLRRGKIVKDREEKFGKKQQSRKEEKKVVISNERGRWGGARREPRA